MIEKGRWNDGFIWNFSICECDQSYDVGKYLDYENCKCKNKKEWFIN